MVKYFFYVVSILRVRGKRRFDFVWLPLLRTVMCSTFSYTAIDKEKRINVKYKHSDFVTCSQSVYVCKMLPLIFMSAMSRRFYFSDNYTSDIYLIIFNYSGTYIYFFKKNIQLEAYIRLKLKRKCEIFYLLQRMLYKKKSLLCQKILKPSNETFK